MSEADAYRATPGNVYGIAVSYSGGEEPYIPHCECPCHLANAPRPSNWYCDTCGTCLMSFTTEDVPRVNYTHKQAIADGRAAPRQPMRMVADYYFITKGNTLKDELGEHFMAEDEAKARAAELNERDVIKARDLTKKQEVRARRLRDLSCGGYWSDGFSWIRKLKRYALEIWDDGSSWDTVSTLGQVEKELRENQHIERVIDLDTGEAVAFTRTVQVEVQA